MWLSPSNGVLQFEDMLECIKDELLNGEQETYRLMVGCDSHTRGRTTFVTAIILHKVGKGAKFFYQKQTVRRVSSLTQKIYMEANLSLTVANMLAEKLDPSYFPGEIEIHVDVGHKGETRKLIKEVIGMISGSGFPCMIKPRSVAASWCADRFSKVEGELTTLIQ